MEECLLLRVECGLADESCTSLFLRLDLLPHLPPHRDPPPATSSLHLLPRPARIRARNQRPSVDMSTPSDSPPAAEAPKAAAPPKVKGPAVDKKAAKAARRAQKVAERPGEAPLAATPTAPTPVPKNASLSVPEESGSAPKPRRPSNSGQARPQLIRGAAAASSSKPSAAAAAVAAPPAVPAGPTLHPLVANIPGSKLSSTTSVANVHPAIIKLGLQLKEGTIRGANARLIAGLNGLKQVRLKFILFCP